MVKASGPKALWRPPQMIRPIAIAVIVRRIDGAMLLMSVRDEAAGVDGWRPIGGTIEFGERGAEAVRRESVEELGEDLADVAFLGVLENLYEMGGAKGHELVMVYRARFADPAAETRDFDVTPEPRDAGSIKWVSPSELSRGTLFPEGLDALL